MFKVSAGLGHAISLAVAVALVLVTLSLTALSYVTTQASKADGFEHSGIQQTNLLAATLGGAVRFRKSEDVAASLDAFATVEGQQVSWIAVTDAAGSTVAAFGTPPDDPGTARPAAEALGSTPIFRDTVSAGLITFGAAGDAVGVLEIGWDTRRMEADLRATAIRLLAFGFGLSAITALSAWLLVRQFVARPIRNLNANLDALSAGDYDQEISLAQRGDEIGAMARGVAGLRDRLRENATQREADLAARSAAEARKSEMLHALGSGVGGIVAAAQTGDFSQRVAQSFEDETLTALADGINALSATIDDFLDEIDQSTAALVAGDLTRRMPARFTGRFGEVGSGLNDMAGHISGLMGELGTSERAIRSSATQIEADAHDLSRRSENQASALEETAATMEQLKASTIANSKNIKASAAQAEETRRRADTGREIVTRANEAMSEIEAGSTRISEITSVIDGIAFQTNLLALNAAVEAARAGEAGKGFTVVASEVRTLAQRSADAARDITELIETSRRQVENGAELVNQSGDVLSSILGSIAEVSAALAQISTATQDQSQGITEISQAVSNLDETTQMSAQIAVKGASSAEELGRQAKRLADLLARFRTEGGGADAAHNSAAA
ncbi:MAG: methyl-accepting chemotaxis protein [Pseudomonadota bacterium]